MSQNVAYLTFVCTHFENQTSPDALVLGEVDKALEDKINRREEREVAEAARRQKEEDRVAKESAAGKNSGYHSDGEADEGESDETIKNDAKDATYKASWEGHERKRNKRIKLDIDVKELQESFSGRADHYLMSSNARFSVFSDFVVSGGANLKEVPCSQSTMRRCSYLHSFLLVCL